MPLFWVHPSLCSLTSLNLKDIDRTVDKLIIKILWIDHLSWPTFDPLKVTVNIVKDARVFPHRICGITYV